MSSRKKASLGLADLLIRRVGRDEARRVALRRVANVAAAINTAVKAELAVRLERIDTKQPLVILEPPHRSRQSGSILHGDFTPNTLDGGSM
jgi:hypothetical protein